MLQFMRNQASSWVVKILMILLVISFAIWGIGDIFRSRAGSVAVASVGDDSLSPEQLRNMVDRSYESFRARFPGASFVDDSNIRNMLAQNNIQQWITEKLYIQEAHHMGLAVSDEVLRKNIATNPTFQDESHRFSADRFRRVLQASNLTEAQFLTLMRQSIVNQQLAGALGSSIYPPKILQQATFAYQNESRDAVVMEVPYSKFPAFAKLLGKDKVGNPTEDELSVFLEQNKETFSTPEYRRLTVLTLSPSDLAKDAKISEDELKQAFETHKSEYETPEKRTIKQVVVAEKSDADAIYAEASKSKSLEDAVKKTGKGSVVDLGQMTRSDLPQEELAKATFEDTKLGDLSKPVQTPLGWHVVKIEKVTPAKTVTFADVKSDLMQKVAMERSTDDIYKLSDQLQDDLAGGAKLEDVAKKIGAKIHKVELIDREGRDTTGKPIALPLAKSRDPLLKVAFSTDPGKNGGLTEAQEGGFFVVHVDETVAPRLKSLKDVRDKVLTAWQTQDRETTGAILAEKLAQEVKAGKKLSELAQTYGLSTRPVSQLKRDAVANNPELIQPLFAVKKGQPAIVPNPNGFSIGVVTALHPSDKKMGDGEIGIQTLLKRELAQDISDQLQNALRDRFDVQVNRKALETMY